MNAINWKEIINHVDYDLMWEVARVNQKQMTHDEFIVVNICGVVREDQNVLDTIKSVMNEDDYNIIATKVDELWAECDARNEEADFLILINDEDSDTEDDDCICGEEPNKNCDQHCCLQCCEPKTKFNDVAWLCAPCQKKIDDEVDNYTDEEEDDICECENCGANFDNEGWSPKMKYCEHCDDELRNNGL